jgi:hypothetical protein
LQQGFRDTKIRFLPSRQINDNKENQMKDILFFDSMVTPKIITFVYWLLLLIAVAAGLGTMFGGFGGFSITKFFMGIIYAVCGAIAARIWCELLIVLFKMNEALQELRRK